MKILAAFTVILIPISPSQKFGTNKKFVYVQDNFSYDIGYLHTSFWVTASKGLRLFLISDICSSLKWNLLQCDPLQFASLLSKSVNSCSVAYCNDRIIKNLCKTSLKCPTETKKKHQMSQKIHRRGKKQRIFKCDEFSLSIHPKKNQIYDLFVIH